MLRNRRCKTCFRYISPINIENVLISCGVNDIDEKPGLDVALEIINTVNRIKLEHPLTKIVVSEVTPRNDVRDSEVRACNSELHERLNDLENVFLVKLDNLRDETWSKYRDVKHIKERCIPLFAATLKAGLRKAQNTFRPNRQNYNRQGETLTYNNPPRHSNYDSLEAQHRPFGNSSRQGNINSNVPINQRLLDISANNVTHSSPKQTLIPKLADVIKCLEVW